MRSCLLFLLLLIAPGLLLPGAAQTPAPPLPATVAARIQLVENSLLPYVPVTGLVGWNLRERMKFHRVPGLSIAVIHNYRVEWARAYGWADTTARTPATPAELLSSSGARTFASLLAVMDLAQFFNQVPDPRRAEGKRTPLPALLWMTFLAVASGHGGYRAMSKFAKSNAAFFASYFGLRHAVPSHVSFRSVLQALDEAFLYQAFNNHFAAQVAAGDWVAGDGQSLRSTVQQAQGAGQCFVSVVSLYCQRTGLAAAMQPYTDQKNGELSVLRNLLPLLQDRGVVLTLDALHGQKKQLPPS